MARNQKFIDVPPEAIWRVLSRPVAYADWVVGSDSIRDVEGEWPAPGSRFHHRVGKWPFTIHDHTEVVESVPNHKLVLRAKGRPLGVAIVKMVLTARDGGTEVTMEEDPDGWPWRLLMPPPVQPLIKLRNVESLRRLAKLAREEAQR